MKLTRAIFVNVVLVAVFNVTGHAAARQAAPQASGCDEACLLKLMDRFVTAMTSQNAGAVPLAQDAEIRENTKVVPLDQTAWKRVTKVRSAMTFADPVTGNVVSRAGVQLEDGKPGYISTRLRVVRGGRIGDVELSSDTSSRVISAYVWSLDPRFSAPVPPEQRMSRMALEALGRRYFNSLSSHQAVEADFDDLCDRFHSGQRVTNVAANSVEGGAPRTCASSLEGNPPWGPATEHRFPVVDVEHGIVVGITLLHYPNLPNHPQMYVSEMFKVVGGRITRIDNIGLMLEGAATLGFVH